MGRKNCDDGGEWLKQAQSNCGMFIVEDVKNTASPGPQQPASKWELPLLCAGIGPDDLMRLMYPNYFILEFCEKLFLFLAVM